MGVRILSQRLHTKKALIILDDVGHVKHLNALCGHMTWFGLGSKIIITSRDERLLIEHEVEERYQVKELTDDEALGLFIQKSFKGNQVGKDFLELSKNFVVYANGFPLAIEVLGSSPFRRSNEEWSSALDGLKENPERKIIDVLKVSYDGLQQIEKKVFLDIACFFKGEDKHRITRILESSYGYHPVIDIKVLMEKCLLTPVGRKLSMHDMIQEMGWEIVCRERPEEVGSRSRLWLSKEITHVLESNMETAAVQSILLNLPKEEEVNLNVNHPLLKMDRLRLLKIRNGNFSGNIKYLSNELALLDWDSCPLNTLPSNYESDEFVELRVHPSRINNMRLLLILKMVIYFFADHPSMMLVSKPLKGNNHSTWSRAMRISLSAKNKLSFVDEISDSILYMTDAHAILRERCSQSHAPRIFQLQRDIASLTQDQLSIAAYYTKLKKLWDELASYSDSTSCTC
nr:TMV resistance protein N-like [Malus domestica]